MEDLFEDTSLSDRLTDFRPAESALEGKGADTYRVFLEFERAPRLSIDSARTDAQVPRPKDLPDDVARDLGRLQWMRDREATEAVNVREEEKRVRIKVQVENVDGPSPFQALKRTMDALDESNFTCSLWTLQGLDWEQMKPGTPPVPVEKSLQSVLREFFPEEK